MIQTILGKKIDQTSKFLSSGKRIPVTRIHVPDNPIVQIKTTDRDKYQAIQIGIGKNKRPTKALIGHVKKSGLSDAPSKIAEVKVNEEDIANLPKPGGSIKLEEVLKPGDMIDVTGVSKGKGFAGVVKRYNFGGGPKTHGQSDRHRAPGSIGQGTTPGRVYKGKLMAGHMGHVNVTVKNLSVVDIDQESKMLYVSGLIPGVKNSVVFINRTGEDKNFVSLHKVEEPKEEAEGSPEATKETTSNEPKPQPSQEKQEESKESKVEEKAQSNPDKKENDQKGGEK